ncbi:MAG: hypothetical protein HQL06_10540 [Nitrospirae bacterium]|nr:hypothetical protein [Nitrospirota bacterium]
MARAYVYCPDFYSTGASSIGIKDIIVETLSELSKEPPDRLTLYFYHFVNDFKDFKSLTNRRFEEIEIRLDRIEDNMVTKDDIKDMVTKTELRDALKDVVAMVGVSVRCIIREELENRH